MADRLISRRALLVLFAATAAAACAPAQSSAPAAKPAEAPKAAPQPPEAAKPVATAQAAPAAAGGGKPFTIVDGAEPNSLDPPIGTAGPIGHAMRGMLEGLVTFNGTMEPVPQLATGWESTPDLKTWTFKLRSGVKFHDGTPFNSEAVKFSVMRIMDPEVASTRRSSYEMIEEIQTPDAETAVFVLKSPQPDMPALLGDRSAMIVSPTAVQKIGNKDFGRQPAGTGQCVLRR